MTLEQSAWTQAKNISLSIVLGLTLFTSSQVKAQDACVAGTGTIPSDGCFVSDVYDITYTLTSDTPISSPQGLTGIRIMNADRNTLSYDGDITSVALNTYGLYLSTADHNIINITGDISTDGYGVITTHGNYNDITLNGNITTSKYLSYGAMIIAELNTNFTLNGNITTTAEDTPAIMLYNSSNMNVLINGNINVEGGGGSFGLNARGIDVSGSSGSTITNLGTINTIGDNPFDIYVREASAYHPASTLATLNNSQSGLTYYGKIPTNYNAVINSTSDYGKIIFSTVSGTTSFGIYDGSVLENNTTYASVIDGLEDADITATRSGNYTYDGRTWAWTLENSSANLWDLIVGTCTGCILEDTQDSVEEIQDSISVEFSQLLQLSEKATGSFANMNTYDCSLFDTEGKCYSMGVRQTDVNGNNVDSYSTGAVFVAGHKFSNNYRISGFIDQQISRKDPKGISVRNKGPMVGVNLVWNQFANRSGFQFRLANSYLAKDMTITRSGKGNSEKGTGETEIKAQNYVAELSYKFSDRVKTSYEPYFATRRSIIKQDGYTETGVANPLTYNAIEDKSTTLVMGIKANYKYNNEITFNGAYGIEHDVSNNVDKLQATSSTIEGIESVELNDTINKTRPIVTLGSTYNFSRTQFFTAQFQYQELASSNTDSKTAYFNYTVGF